MKIFKQLFCILSFVVFISCGKNYNCTCTSESTTASGSGTTTTKIENTTTDRYHKKEVARKMCEDTKVNSTSPSATLQTTCVLQ